MGPDGMLSAIGRRGGWPSWASVLVHSICTGESDPCDRTGTSIGLAACAATLSLLSPISSAANCRLRLVVTICRRRPCHGPKALFPRVKSQSGEASLGVSRRGPRARSFLVSFLPAPNSHRHRPSLLSLYCTVQILGHTRAPRLKRSRAHYCRLKSSAVSKSAPDRPLACMTSPRLSFVSTNQRSY